MCRCADCPHGFRTISALKLWAAGEQSPPECYPARTDPNGFRPVWQPEEIPLGDGRTLVLDDS